MLNDYKIQNPIIPGFYPDPSICRVGKDYYIANSSFSFFPGVPLFHSRDLAHWECIGYALSDPKQLRLNPERTSGGLFAPTIRYHEGLFYVIVGNMTTGENLLVTAEDPRGPWSDAHLIDGVGGDPSLFWDDDGTCWCSYSKMGTASWTWTPISWWARSTTCGTAMPMTRTARNLPTFTRRTAGTIC